MTSEKQVPNVLKIAISSLNTVYLELEQLLLQKQDEEKREDLMEEMQKQHAATTVFDESATMWLQRTRIEKAASIVSAPCRLRSTIAQHLSSQLKSKGMQSNSTSTSSSFSSRKVVAKKRLHAYN